MFRTLSALTMMPLKMTRRKNVEKTKATCSFGNDEYGLQTGNVKISNCTTLKVIRLRWNRIFSFLN